MLGVNLLFAGFALTLNGFSYRMNVDNKAKGAANALVGAIIGVNAIFQTAQATDHATFGFSAAMWLFALNYFIIAAHIFLNSENWKVFGMYGLFASLVSIVFAVDSVLAGLWIMVYLWLMWAILWAQSFFAIVMENKTIDKTTIYILVLNGIASTFAPGILMLLGVILL